MYYNQFDFEAALESMDSVNLCPQGYRCIEAGEADFISTVLEAYDDMYAALEAGDLDEAMDIYYVLEEMSDEIEEDPDIGRKVKRKAFMKKVGKGAATLGGTVAAGAAYGAGRYVGIQRRLNKSIGDTGGYLSAGVDGARIGAKYGVGIAAMTAAGRGVYGAVKKRRDAKATAAELEDEAQESYGYFNR